MGLSDVVYGVYERRLRRQIPPERRPRHVGVILDGNRRWATSQGSGSEAGHRAGAAKIVEFLGWCEDADVEVVTLWLLSTDNLNRPPAELEPLLAIIEEVVADLAAAQHWRMHVVGALDLLPDATAQRLQEAAASTAAVDGMVVNVAIGYGGRREIADAVRLIAEDVRRGRITGRGIDERTVARYLTEPDMPDVDLFVRSSGEQRTSNFLLWQSAYAEMVFQDTLWPDYDRRHLWAAVEEYVRRERRYGGALDLPQA